MNMPRKTLPLLILVLLSTAAWLVLKNPPEAQRQVRDAGPRLAVDVMPLRRQAYHVALDSYGTVQPRTESLLLAQVSGLIISINDSLRDGGFFEAGEVLLTIDPRDYEADVRIAEAALMDARQLLAEEEARAAQALEDWNRLGNQGEAPDLVLRKPQLMAARARVISAESALQKAGLELERTRIVAPYAGRVMEKFVDVGQVVNPGSQLARVYAVDYVEIRLPIRNRDLAFIDLPEMYRVEQGNREQRRPGVEIFSELAGNTSWQGRVVRTESTIDSQARQLHVVAQVDDPFGKDALGRPPLKIGQYVTAQLSGKVLDGALVIPNKTIYQGSYVYIVENGTLQRRDIHIAWQNQGEAVIADGLSEGDKLVLTPLGQVMSGLRVRISNDAIQGSQATFAAGGSGTGGGKLQR